MPDWIHGGGMHGCWWEQSCQKGGGPRLELEEGESIRKEEGFCREEVSFVMVKIEVALFLW